MDVLRVWGSILGSFSSWNPHQNPYKNQLLFYSKNHRKLIRKWPHFGRGEGVQRTSFSLPEPLLGSAWRPRGPRTVPEEAQIPPREPKAPKNHRMQRKIIETSLKNHRKSIEKALKHHLKLIKKSQNNHRTIIEQSLKNHFKNLSKCHRNQPQKP